MVGLQGSFPAVDDRCQAVHIRTPGWRSPGAPASAAARRAYNLRRQAFWARHLGRSLTVRVLLGAAAALFTAEAVRGYELAGLGAAADGCAVCPECGAAWRVAA